LRGRGGEELLESVQAVGGTAFGGVARVLRDSSFLFLRDRKAAVSGGDGG
jgi:hypothetical protein